MRSYSIATVHDLGGKIHVVIGERWRTNTNETEKETTRTPQPAAPTPQSAASPTAHPQGQSPLHRLGSKPHADDHGHEPKPEAPRDQGVHLGTVRRAADVGRYMRVVNMIIQ
jgi:hypothetical protein